MARNANLVQFPHETALVELPTFARKLQGVDRHDASFSPPTAVPRRLVDEISAPAEIIAVALVRAVLLRPAHDKRFRVVQSFRHQHRHQQLGTDDKANLFLDAAVVQNTPTDEPTNSIIAIIAIIEI